MKRVNMVFTYLQNHPIIGYASAVGGWTMSIILNVFTNDAVLKGLGVFSIWAGALLVILSLVAQVLKIIKEMK